MFYLGKIQSVEEIKSKTIIFIIIAGSAKLSRKPLNEFK